MKGFDSPIEIGLVEKKQSRRVNEWNCRTEMINDHQD